MKLAKIDKKIPFPEWGRKRGRPLKYPWDDMEVGDSFMFTKGSSKQNASQQAYLASIRLRPKSFKSAKDEEGNFRCWRIK